MSNKQDYDPRPLKNLKYDVPAGIVVFLVALPLCLGIAQASGASALSGLIAGVVGGLVVGMLSKSAQGVSGPAAGIATMVVATQGSIAQKFDYAIDDPRTFQIFIIVALIAGVFQVIFGYIKAGVITNFFANNVIKGMLAAIGILIFLKQIPHALGDDKDTEGDVKFSQDDGNNTFTEIWDALQDPHIGAIIIATISLLIMIMWQHKRIKNHKVLGLIPAPLLVVVFGILLNQFFLYGLPGSVSKHLALLPSHRVKLDLGGDLSAVFTNLVHPDFSVFYIKTHYYTSIIQQITDLVVMGFTLAMVLSLQTLLSGEATDKLDPFKRITPPNNELKAQGIGNIVSALIGGLPMTQVIVRSSANINAGGRTRMSAIIHGVLLVLCILFIPFVLTQIPLACLAGILFYIGYRLASVKLFKDMIKLGNRHYLPFLVTIGTIIVTDLLTGVVIGLVVSVFFILRNNRRNEPFDVKIERNPGNDFAYMVHILLHEEITYLSKHILMLSLHDVPVNSMIYIDGSRTKFIAQDILEEINEFIQTTAKRKNIKVEFQRREILQHDVDPDLVRNINVRV